MHMKFVRIIAAVLILVLASSPALAASCAASCTAGEITASASSVAYAGSAAMTMAHCYDATTQSDKQSGKHQSDTKHKNMVGCHGVQAAPLHLQAQVPAVDFTNTLLPPFSPFGVSADLSPPLKPPA